MPKWMPSATPEILRQRADLNRYLRAFFAERDVLEVEVPVLARAAATDPHLDSIGVKVSGQSCYLQTSPEFFMKRMLAAGSGDIYSLGKAFRNGESGRRHNPEFTMLEWYRVGWSEHKLMEEVEKLVAGCVDLPSVETLSYARLFERELQVNPHEVSTETLKDLVSQHVDVALTQVDRDACLDLLMSHVIEPRMGQGLVFVYDFPASQAALARLDKDDNGHQIARRFEAYLGGVELANGYWELCDASEQQQRLQHDLARREALGLPYIPIDRNLLESLRSGLPDCAGVALGVDRLLMRVAGSKDLRQLLSFPFEKV